MIHKAHKRKLGRTTSHRKALLKNLALALIAHGKIKSTLPKCKELRVLADGLVTLGKKGDTTARRRAFAILRDKNAVNKLFSEITPKFQDLNEGGYTRIVRLQPRHGDAAEMAIIEFVA